MLTWRTRLLLVAFAALACYAAVLAWQVGRLRAREIDARAAAQRAALDAAGWQRAAEGTRAELARIVPDLRAQIEAAKAANAIVAATSHWTGHGGEVAVPCVTMGPSAGTTRPTSSSRPPDASQPGAPPTIAVTPHVRIDDAVAIDDAGGIYVARRVQARLSVGTAWASAWAPVEADPGSTTAVDPRVEAAWRAYRNPPPRIAALPRGIKAWRAGWFVGPGLAVALDGRVSAGVLVGWGVEF